MSSSSRLHNEIDSSKVDLPVFVTPSDLVFSTNKKRSFLTVFNPYGNEAQFRIMTTNPDRFDVSASRGTIKSNRRIDITIRLLNHKIEELPEPTEEYQIIDYFRITLQVGQLKGNRRIAVQWCSNADLLNNEESLLDDKSSKLKLKSSKSQTANQSLQLGSTPISAGHNQRFIAGQRCTSIRSARQVDPHGGSNVNLVCTVCAIVCVITLFLPLSMDFELCKKAKTFQDQASAQSASLLSQLSALLSVSYEMKIGCSFALGLFTYRLISTLPD